MIDLEKVENYFEIIDTVNKIHEWFKSYEKIIIAYSGGKDSGVMLFYFIYF